jgi:inorganic pyrophosphatase
MSKSNLFLLACVVAIYVFCAGACVHDGGSYTPKLPKHKVATSGEGIFARVLVPAGSSVNQHIRGGPNEPKPFDFLPYPGNWAEVIRPDQKTLHVMILTDALAKGSTLGIKPIAVIQLDSSGVPRDIIIAVPTDSLLMSVQLDGFSDLITDYEPVRYVLQTWFVNHRGFGAFEVVGWRDENYAHKLLSDGQR